MRSLSLVAITAIAVLGGCTNEAGSEIESDDSPPVGKGDAVDEVDFEFAHLCDHPLGYQFCGSSVTSAEDVFRTLNTNIAQSYIGPGHRAVEKFSDDIFCIRAHRIDGINNRISEDMFGCELIVPSELEADLFDALLDHRNVHARTKSNGGVSRASDGAERMFSARRADQFACTATEWVLPNGRRAELTNEFCRISIGESFREWFGGFGEFDGGF